jgi:excisionase family DNA binding protein
MAAYATSERTAQNVGLQVLRPNATQESSQPLDSSAGVEALLSRLANLVAERVVAHLNAPPSESDDWFDTRAAAEYLGVHRDTVRRLATERTVPSEQEGPGCKLFFRRSDLDAWRCSDRRHVRVLAGGRS